MCSNIAQQIIHVYFIEERLEGNTSKITNGFLLLVELEVAYFPLSFSHIIQESLRKYDYFYIFLNLHVLLS